MKRRRVLLLWSVVVAVPIALLPASASAGAAAWSVVPSPNVGTVNELNAVVSVSANDVWAVGEASQQTLTEHWDGSAWSIVPSPNVAASDGLFGVAAVSSTNVWAVGRVNTATPPLIEHWNGTRWRVVKAAAQPGFLGGITAVSAKDLWAVGSFLNASHVSQTLIEHWDGTAWSVVPSPNVGTQNNQLNGVTAVSANDVWAVGFSESSGIEQTLTLHWEGTKWSVVPSPNVGTQNNQLSGVAAVPANTVSANTVWAVGETVAGSSVQSLIERWSGGSWSVVASPGAGELSGIAIVSHSDIWAVGSALINFSVFQTLIEQWNGSSWTVVPSPNPSASQNVLNGAAADPSSGQAWAVGDYFNNTSNVLQTLTEFNP